MNVTYSAPSRCARPRRPLPPPDPRAVGWQPRHWDAGPDLSVATSWWARSVLPRRIGVLVPGPRSNHARLSAGAMTALLCLAWGCLIGACAGAAAGTMIVPLLGTFVGGAIGAPIGAIVGSAWAVFTVTVLAVRHRRVPSPHATLP